METCHIGTRENGMTIHQNKHLHAEVRVHLNYTVRNSAARLLYVNTCSVGNGYNENAHAYRTHPVQMCVRIGQVRALKNETLKRSMIPLKVETLVLLNVKTSQLVRRSGASACGSEQYHTITVFNTAHYCDEDATEAFFQKRHPRKSAATHIPRCRIKTSHYNISS